MLSILKVYFSRLSALHDELKNTIAGLPQEALDWTPGSEMLSLGVVMAHAAGAERYWIGEVVGQDPSQRDRPAEFRTHGLSAEELEKRLDAALDHSQGVLKNLSLEDLDGSRLSPRDGRTVSVYWSLAHALEHTAIHLGHAQVTRQLWEQRGGK